MFNAYENKRICNKYLFLNEIYNTNKNKKLLDSLGISPIYQPVDII